MNGDEWQPLEESFAPKTDNADVINMPVMLREDGYPADTRIRSAVLRLRVRMQDTNSRLMSIYEMDIRLEDAARSLKGGKDIDSWWPGSAKVIAAIKSSGVLVLDPQLPDRYMFAETRRAPTTPEAKLANYQAMIRATAHKACDGDLPRIRMEEFVTRVRALHSAAKIEVGGVKALLIPQGFELSLAGPRVSNALILLDGPRGLCVYSAQGNAVSTEWTGTSFTHTVDGSGMVPDEAATRRIASTRLMPRTKESCMVLIKAAETMRKALGYLSGQKEMVSKIVGEDIEPRRWLSLLATIRRGRNLSGAFRSILFGSLDVGARRAALRDPKATYELYNWFRSGDDEQRQRRAQASAAFPFMTRELPRLTEVIDSGGELVPALAQLSGLSVPQLRRLSGMHWQKLGSAFRDIGKVIGSEKSFFDAVPPERMPVTRAEWSSAFDIGSKWHELANVAPAVRKSFGHAMSKDWDGYSKLMKSDLLHALRNTAQLLAPLMTGEINSRAMHCNEMFAVLFGVVGGENFGLKRLVRFTKEWHAGEPRRSSAYRALRRQAFGDELIDWKPLTKDNFSCGHGTLTWLINEDELVDEGMRMMHCVGSYSQRCISGHSHIASVQGADGSRSTAEFATSGQRLELIQNQSYRNRTPGEGAQAVVAEFMAANRRKKFSVRKKRRTRREALPMPRPFVTMTASDEMKDTIRRIFADVLPANVLSWSPVDWKLAKDRYYDPEAFQKRAIPRPYPFQNAAHRAADVVEEIQWPAELYELDFDQFFEP